MDEADLKRLLDASVAETRLHFDLAAERLENKIRLIAETHARFDEEFDRRFDEVEGRVERGFAETQAMI